MRWILVLAVAACRPSWTPEAQPPKQPARELIVGDFALPDGALAIRFRSDGRYVLAKTMGELDSALHVEETNYLVEEDHAEGDIISLITVQGPCAFISGVHWFDVSAKTLRFTFAIDDCAERARLTGKTLWRL